MVGKNSPVLTFDDKELKKEQLRCHSFMSLLYKEYINL